MGRPEELAELAELNLEPAKSGKWYICHCQSNPLCGEDGHEWNYRALDRHRIKEAKLLKIFISLPQPCVRRSVPQERPGARKDKGKGKVGGSSRRRSTPETSESDEAVAQQDSGSSDIEIVDRPPVRAPRPQTAVRSPPPEANPAPNPVNPAPAKRQRLSPPRPSPTPRPASPSRVPSPPPVASTSRVPISHPPATSERATPAAPAAPRPSQPPTPTVALSQARQQALDNLAAQLAAEQLAEDQAREAETVRQAAAQAHAARQLEAARAQLDQLVAREDRVAAWAEFCEGQKEREAVVMGVAEGVEDRLEEDQIRVKEEEGERGRESAGMSPGERKAVAREERAMGRAED